MNLLLLLSDFAQTALPDTAELDFCDSICKGCQSIPQIFVILICVSYFTAPFTTPFRICFWQTI